MTMMMMMMMNYRLQFCYSYIPLKDVLNLPLQWFIRTYGEIVLIMLRRHQTKLGRTMF